MKSILSRLLAVVLSLALIVPQGAMAQAGFDPRAGPAFQNAMQAKTASAANTARIAARLRRVAALGDSITANNHLITNTSTNYGVTKSSRGYMTFAEILSKRAWYWDETLNFGVAGENTSQILARVPQVIAANPGAVVVLAGVNDGQGSVLSVAQTKANLRAIWTQLANAGILVVVVPILPASMWGSQTTTASQRRIIQQTDNWIREVAPTIPNVILADPTAYLIDNTTANSNQGGMIGGQTGAVTGYALDGLHPAQRGAFWTGYVVAQALAPYFNTPLNQSQQSALDVYNATDNPSGNLLSNGIITATSGGVLGTGASGAAPSGMTLQRGYGTVAVATGSFITMTLPNGQPLNKYRIAMSAPSGSTSRDSMTLSQSISVSPGDVVYLELEEDVSGITADSWLGQRLQMSAAANGVQYNFSVADPDTSPASYVMPNYAFSGTLRTAKFTVPAGVTSIYVFYEVFLLGSVANAGVTVDISRMVARKVPAG
jgi:lysophospholipase L1-like esterase